MKTTAILLTLIGFIMTVPASVEAVDFSIRNDSDADLQIKVFHFEDLSKVWTPPTLPDGRTSAVVNMASGNRIIVAKDTSTGKIVFTQNIKVEDRGMQILLANSGGEIRMDISFNN